MWRGRMGLTPEEQLHLYAHPQGKEDDELLEELEADALQGEALADAEAELCEQLAQFRRQVAEQMPAQRAEGAAEQSAEPRQ